MEFKEMGLSRQLLSSLEEMKFTTPTPIQEQAIPILLKGEDLVGQAQTGTGKTAAFGLPILEAWLKSPFAQRQEQPRQERFNSHDLRAAGEFEQRHERDRKPEAAPYALILVPTRELAVQVHQTLEKMASHSGARVVAIYGGVEMRRQLRMFRSPVDIVVGTPGRTLDHMRQGTLQLGEVRTAVLDEADRMLDMGFIRDVVKILDGMPGHRQTMLFSATMPKEVAHIAQKYMKKPQTIKVSEDRLTVEGIKQLYVRCNNSQRLGMLLAIMRTEKPFLAIVFCRMKHEAKKLARMLKTNGIRADALHGNLNQNARERAMDGFRTGKFDVLVATDLASRGIDVPGITHVINYELPADPMTYVHRIGRTGRAGEKGTAISLISGEPRHALWEIERATGAKVAELILEPDTPIMPSREEGRDGSQHKDGGRGGHYGGRNNEGQNRHNGGRHERPGNFERRERAPFGKGGRENHSPRHEQTSTHAMAPRTHAPPHVAPHHAQAHPGAPRHEPAHSPRPFSPPREAVREHSTGHDGTRVFPPHAQREGREYPPRQGMAPGAGREYPPRRETGSGAGREYPPSGARTYPPSGGAGHPYQQNANPYPQRQHAGGRHPQRGIHSKSGYREKQQERRQHGGPRNNQHAEPKRGPTHHSSHKRRY